MAEAFRRFRLVRKTRESEVITSFHFIPVDGGALWPARPGQYLTLRIPAEGQPKGHVLRTYSLSNAVDAQDCHRISVKREAGDGTRPDGIGSCFLHDTLAEGDEIDIAAPRGDFFFDDILNRKAAFEIKADRRGAAGDVADQAAVDGRLGVETGLGHRARS